MSQPSRGIDRGSPHVTQLLQAWSDGQEDALERLIPLVHRDLLAAARRYMARERAGHLLQPTALVNEAYVRLVDIRRIRWQDRAHFLALAARLMRNILIEFARAQRFQKRGGARQQVVLDEALVSVDPRPYDLLALDEALERLAAIDPRRGRIVELRFFGGLTIEETAVALRVSADTVGRDWKLAKAWLARAMRGDRASGLRHRQDRP
jgi:RNA polymerase sigma-70 factor, ECF subfamily